MEGTYWEVLVAVGITGALYSFCLAIHRLYFSQLAKFPGPKLAAVTLWYEFYYDVIKRGRYTWKIGQLHEKYGMTLANKDLVFLAVLTKISGPIVRISPNELHINDPDYYDEVYVGSSRRTMKYEWATRGFGITVSAFGSEGHEAHRNRRSALAPFFSKASVYQLEPAVQSIVDKLVSRLQAVQKTENVVNLVNVFVALTADIIVQYAFAKPYGFIESPDFASHWHKTMMDLSESFHTFKQFGWMEPLMRKIPPKIVVRMNPQMGALFSLGGLVRQQVSEAKEEVAQGKKPEGQKTIFYNLLTNDQLPPEDKTVERLEAEGLSVFGAGSMTVAHTLSVITFHLIDNKGTLENLQTELRKIMPYPDSKPKWSQLEQLPYLTAVILEGLRWGHGVTSRLQRISPDVPLRYKEWTIPPGVPVGMSAPLIHDNPSIFPNPRNFCPERWLQPNSSDLRKYLVAFSKGSRQCLGMNLAYCELYLTLAAIFAPGRFSFELFQTNKKDVEVAHDFFNASFPVESKGIRVVVK